MELLKIQTPELWASLCSGHMAPAVAKQSTSLTILFRYGTLSFNHRNKDISIIRTVVSDPKVSGIEEFHCTRIKGNPVHHVHSEVCLPMVCSLEGIA